MSRRSRKDPARAALEALRSAERRLVGSEPARWPGRYEGAFAASGARSDSEPLRVSPSLGAVSVERAKDGSLWLDLAEVGPMFAAVAELRPIAPGLAIVDPAAFLAGEVPAQIASGLLRLSADGRAELTLDVVHGDEHFGSRSVLTFIGTRTAAVVAAGATLH